MLTWNHKFTNWNVSILIPIVVCYLRIKCFFFNFWFNPIRVCVCFRVNFYIQIFLVFSNVRFLVEFWCNQQIREEKFWDKKFWLIWNFVRCHSKFWENFLFWCFFCGLVFIHLRAYLANSSKISSWSLFLGILPTNSRWLLNDIVTPIFLPFRIS